ncbi:MAG: MoxR family ATPase, partial [Pseudobdellovibrionaceae bacterium]|nr:MoxR family ATPase [Pseudobdellovibrionaceae bacterium]
TQLKLQSLRKELNQVFFERSQVIDGLLGTMLHGSNAILFGPPGTAKSDLVQAICCSITGTVYFNRLLFKTMPPEELLGQASLRELTENDRLVRNTKGRLPDADVAFLDEIFKCSPATLNSLLRIANEREFDNPEPKKIPLIFMVGASNEVPTETEMLAFLDRFIFKTWVLPLRREKSRRDLIAMADSGKRQQVATRLTMQELKDLQIEARKVPLHSKVVEQLLILAEEFQKKNLYMSDRKLVKIVELLKCLAFVQGDQAVSSEHLHELLPYCVANMEDEVKEAKQVLKDKCPTLLNQALDWLDRAKKCAVEATEAASRFSRDRMPVTERQLNSSIESATKNVSAIKQQLDEAIAEWKDVSPRIQRIAQSIDDILTDIAGYKELIYR